MNDEMNSRRQFLQQASLAGLSLFLPTSVGCVHERALRGPEAAHGDGLPLARPERWDPVVFNLQRGRAGASPAAYFAKIEGPDGIAQHLSCAGVAASNDIVIAPMNPGMASWAMLTERRSSVSERTTPRAE